MGVQKNINSTWAVSAEYGLSTYHLFKDKWYQDSVREDFRYQKIKAEIKRFFPKTELTNSLNAHVYIGLEGLFIPERYKKQTNYFYRNQKRYDYNLSRIKNKIYVASLNTGIEWRFKQKWVVDTYFGLGPRFIHIRHYDTELYPDPPYVEPGFNLFKVIPRDRQEGLYRTLHVALGFKYGYYI